MIIWYALKKLFTPFLSGGGGWCRFWLRVHKNVTKLTLTPGRAVRGFIMSSVAEPLAIAPNQSVHS